MSGTEDESPILFLRKEDESDTSAEEWNDKELVKAYGRAMQVAKRKVLKKLQKELNLESEDIEKYINEKGLSDLNNKKAKKKKNKGKNWKVGDSCRAVFSEDGQEYEAVIVKLLDINWCVVRYVGYENEEEVLIKELLPSLGKNMVKLQIEMANNVEQFEEIVTEDTECKDSDYKGQHPNIQYKHEPVEQDNTHGASHVDPRKHYSNMRPPLFSRTPPPPPPPFLPSFLNPPTGSSDEAINSMLMSWYLCGYYTGCYQTAMRHQKEGHIKHHNL